MEINDESRESERTTLFCKYRSMVNQTVEQLQN